VEGDATPLDYIKQAATKSGVAVVIILAIIHVLDYRWKATNALFDPEDTTGAGWVVDRIEPLLPGQRSSLVRCLRRAATVKGLSPKPREPVEHWIT
jgi:hypothetical protein